MTWTDGKPKEIVVCLECGAISHDGVSWAGTCSRGGAFHGPTQTVPVIPLAQHEAEKKREGNAEAGWPKTIYRCKSGSQVGEWQVGEPPDPSESFAGVIESVETATVIPVDQFKGDLEKWAERRETELLQSALVRETDRAERAEALLGELADELEGLERKYEAKGDRAEGQWAKDMHYRTSHAYRKSAALLRKHLGEAK